MSQTMAGTIWGWVQVRLEGEYAKSIRPWSTVEQYNGTSMYQTVSFGFVLAISILSCGLWQMKRPAFAP